MSDLTQRRQFLKLSIATAFSGAFSSTLARSEESIGSLYMRIVPARKGLDPQWALSLVKRGTPFDAGIRTERKDDLPRIGMTAGGIGCGTVYLSGDGRLYVWDIFNQPHEGVVAAQVMPPGNLQGIGDPKKKIIERDGANYVQPPTPDSNPNPFRQGFTLAIEGVESPRALDRSGWEKVVFTGRWPLGITEFSDPACPVEVKLETWTPFIPLSTDDSSLPVTVMEYTLQNKSAKPVKGRLSGMWENPVLTYTKRSRKVRLQSDILRETGRTILHHQADTMAVIVQPPRVDIVFDYFERESYAPWTVEGTAFGSGPAKASAGQSGVRGVNSNASAPGADAAEKDKAVGSLTSPEFVVERTFVRLLLGGGRSPRQTGVELLIDGKVVATATGMKGRNPGVLETFLNMGSYEGRKASIRIIDRSSAPVGYTSVDRIVFTDAGPDGNSLERVADFGTAALTLLADAVEGETGAGERLDAAFELAPGACKTIRFMLTWRFPNMRPLTGPGQQTPHHAVRFPHAAAVARHVADRFEELRENTMKWVATWNDSTLPQWLLDRSILTTNTLQTTNCMVFADRRFWAWEGIGCCAGTCAHVWHYAQGVARLFPDLERNLREVTDFKIAMNPDGSIRFRAEADKTVALDSQSGVVLRTWREHLVSPDNSFLLRVWPGAKKAVEWLIRFDENGRGGLDGLLDGKQHNTLDAEWYGKVHCLCSLYLAALLAGRQMALLAGDPDFAAACGKVHAMGAEKIATLFNGEFYTQDEDPAHSDAIGVGPGCYIDQVIGQWWATQIGLGRVYDVKQIRSALHSLWRYNFVPEIGSFRRTFQGGRFYAMPKEAGLVMCTWPKGGLRDDFKKHWQYGYFNECMSGFEWQVAAHMLQEGEPISAADFGKVEAVLENAADARSLTARGLAVGRAVHDRYSCTKRNPYNEIECSDHYARANASYSLFLAACGFQYDGPAGIIGFDPKIAPEDFRAPFTAAEGWGTFSQQKAKGSAPVAKLKIHHGKLTLRRVRLAWPDGRMSLSLGDKKITAMIKAGEIVLESPLQLTAEGPELLLEMIG